MAQFVEGNDIERKSFKKPNLNKSASTKQKQLSKEHENRLLDLIQVHIQGSHSDISEVETVKEALLKRNKDENKDDKYNEEKSEKDEFKNKKKIPHISFVIDPPSPSLSDEIKMSKFNEIRRHSSHTPCLLTPKDVDANRRHSGNNPSLLGLDKERMRFLSCSPAATRRISVGSLFKSHDVMKLENTKTNLNHQSKLFDYKHDLEDNDKKKMRKRESIDFLANKKLPIINPLVRLPSWPSE